jgi:hypothetical protein
MTYALYRTGHFHNISPKTAAPPIRWLGRYRRHTVL